MALPWIVALAAIVGFVLIGLWAAEAPGAAYRALAHGPGLALHKLVRVRRIFTHRAESWVRTERADDDGRPGERGLRCAAAAGASGARSVRPTSTTGRPR